MSVRCVDHVGVTVPDIEAATRFFCDALDAEILYTTLRREDGPNQGPATEARLGVPAGTAELTIRMLRLPDGPGLELFEFSGPRQHEPAVPSDLGWQHVGFYVDDLEETSRRVVTAGGSVLADPKPLPGLESGPRNRFQYCRTPWGSTLELLTYPDPQPYETDTDLRRWRP